MTKPEQDDRSDGTHPSTSFAIPGQTPIPASVLLETARSFLVSGWCQGHEALDAAGKEVFPGDDGAIRWCELGALVAAVMTAERLEGETYEYDGPLYYLDRALPKCFRKPWCSGARIAWFNDQYANHLSVIAHFDCAIALAKADEAKLAEQVPS